MPTDEGAVRYCALGALIRVFSDGNSMETWAVDAPGCQKLRGQVYEHSNALYGKSLGSVNNELGREAVLRVFEGVLDKAAGVMVRSEVLKAVQEREPAPACMTS